MKSLAFAPATVSNLAVGFDILGLALKTVGEVATVERLERRPEVVIEPVPGFPEIPTDPTQNTAGAGLLRLIAEHKLNFGFRVSLSKQIPVGSGLGGSAASAVAAMVAANALLKKKLNPAQLFEYAMMGEEVASGSRHGDNVAPCLAGGLVLVTNGVRPWVKIKAPTSWRCLVMLPALSINTKTARGILNSLVPIAQVVQQSANLSGFLLGLWNRDPKLVREFMRDVMIEHQRSPLIPGFATFQRVALDLGALGCSISGSGPAIFALCATAGTATKIERAWRKVAQDIDLGVRGHWISPLGAPGARVLKVER